MGTVSGMPHPMLNEASDMVSQVGVRAYSGVPMWKGIRLGGHESSRSMGDLRRDDADRAFYFESVLYVRADGGGDASGVRAAQRGEGEGIRGSSDSARPDRAQLAGVGPDCTAAVGADAAPPGAVPPSGPPATGSQGDVTLTYPHRTYLFRCLVDTWPVAFGTGSADGFLLVAFHVPTSTDHAAIQCQPSRSSEAMECG